MMRARRAVARRRSPATGSLVQLRPYEDGLVYRQRYLLHGLSFQNFSSSSSSIVRTSSSSCLLQVVYTFKGLNLIHDTRVAAPVRLLVPFSPARPVLGFVKVIAHSASGHYRRTQILDDLRRRQ